MTSAFSTGSPSWSLTSAVKVTEFFPSVTPSNASVSLRTISDTTKSPPGVSSGAPLGFSVSSGFSDSSAPGVVSGIADPSAPGVSSGFAVAVDCGIKDCAGIENIGNGYVGTGASVGCGVLASVPFDVTLHVSFAVLTSHFFAGTYLTVAVIVAFPFFFAVKRTEVSFFLLNATTLFLLVFHVVAIIILTLFFFIFKV